MVDDDHPRRLAHESLPAQDNDWRPQIRSDVRAADGSEARPIGPALNRITARCCLQRLIRADELGRRCGVDNAVRHVLSTARMAAFIGPAGRLFELLDVHLSSVRRHRSRTREIRSAPARSPDSTRCARRSPSSARTGASARSPSRATRHNLRRYARAYDSRRPMGR